MNAHDPHAHPSHRIWAFAFGYFAAYVPYTILTKGVTSGTIAEPPWSGTAILPVATFASAVGMMIFLTAKGWWGYAARGRLFGREWPRPRLVTLLSGVATAAIVLTTTLAYSFDGISVLFAMLLMRGGVLLLAPIVDQVTGRKASTIPWYSWAGSGLALVALVVAFADDGGSELTAVAAANIAVYLGGYFFRLRWMSKHAKPTGPDAHARRVAFFVEEQMVATPLALVGLAVLAVALPGGFGEELRRGFTELPTHLGAFALVVLLGVCSQFTGIFGALILLEPQENAYTVPVNRASSILAGVVSSFLAVALFGAAAPSGFELAGASIVVLAILALSWPLFAERARRRRGVVAA
ncbi:MAG: hypothetical protein H6745_19260 [Deltaproteobacteria bacterium]|nr:hypothetical protein [Deltaproteobacteria bacterium]